MMKAVAYYRVSSKGQGISGLGLEAQRKTVREFAKQNKLKIIGEFTEVESGNRSANRPFLKQSIEECKNKNAVLLIATLDRLARNVAFIAALMESEIKFKAVDFPFADEFMLHIRAAFAQLESKMISTRTKLALQAAKKRGVKLGTNAKKLAELNRKKYLAFAKKMKPKIERIINDGYITVREITEELNRKKIRTVTGKEAQWHLSTVHKLLKQIETLE
jgi:DNA invertase Pin-like site-specific DNA recombinase